MDIKLETCFLAFLIGFALYLLVNRVFMVEGITDCNTPGSACDTLSTNLRCYYEPRCDPEHKDYIQGTKGGAGCKADGINQTCRFCDQPGLPSCDGLTPPPPSPPSPGPSPSPSSSGPSPPPPTPPSGDIPKPEYGMCLDKTTAKMAPSMNTINRGKWYGGIKPFNQSNNNIRMIRLFDYYNDEGRKWTKWLIENTDIKVLIGIYQRSIKEQIGLLLKDYSDATPEIKKKWDKNIVGISMGNESNYTDDPNVFMDHDTIKINLDDLQNYKKLKQLPDVPITSVLVANLNVANHSDPTDWNPLKFYTGKYLKAIAESIDVVSVNIYPYWAAGQGACNDNDYFACRNVDNGRSVFYDEMMQVKTAMRNDSILKEKELWITETGWANDNDLVRFGRPQSSSARAQEYYTNILTNLNKISKQDLPDKIFYFTFRDTPTELAYFGLENLF
jgi:exo-beta-1,3-glucanase (GH17 family)